MRRAVTAMRSPPFLFLANLLAQLFPIDIQGPSWLAWHAKGEPVFRTAADQHCVMPLHAVRVRYLPCLSVW